MSKLKKASITNHEATMRELRADPEYAAEFVKVALEEMEDPKTCASALLALRTVAEAYAMAQVAEEAGIQRESLYRALSPSGNPPNGYPTHLAWVELIIRRKALRFSALREPDNARLVWKWLNDCAG